MTHLRKLLNQLLDSDWLVRWSLRLMAAFLLLFWLGLACATYNKTIHNNMGGLVEKRMAEVDALRLSGERVIVKGTCASACTLYMGLPNACTTRGAEWRFHGPSARTAGLGLPFDEFERLSQAMARHYPEPIRMWFLTVARYRTGDTLDVSGADLIIWARLRNVERENDEPRMRLGEGQNPF